MSRYADLWRMIQAPALLALMVGFTFPIRKKIGYLCTIALWIQFAMGLNVLYFGYPGEPRFNFHLSTVAGEALLWLFVATLLCIHFKRKHWEGMRAAMMLLAFITAGIMLFTHQLKGEMLGIMPAPSTNSAFLACCLPMFLEIDIAIARRSFTAIMLIAIFLAGGTTGIAAAGAAILVYYGRSLVKFWRWAPPLMLLLLLIPSNDRATFFTSRGRTHEWIGILNHWLNSDWLPAMFGTGIGTFEWLNPLRAARDGTPRQLFLWAHNEPIQILVENGLFGLCAALNLMVRLLTESLTRETIAITAALVICCATQYPLRMFPFQILIIAVLGISLRERSWQT